MSGYLTTPPRTLRTALADYRAETWAINAKANALKSGDLFRDVVRRQETARRVAYHFRVPS